MTKRQTDLVVQSVGPNAEDPDGQSEARILFNGDQGWEERVIDLSAISAALAGARSPVRTDTLTALIRTNKDEISKARKRGVSWDQICDAYFNNGVPIDPHTLRKLHWRISHEKKQRP